MTRPDADRQEPLAYEPATDEERAAARERTTKALAEAARRHTPEYFDELRARFGVTADAA
jgi:hypothetical protein